MGSLPRPARKTSHRKPKPSKPARKPAKPVRKPAKPVRKPAKPVRKPAKPARKPAKPAKPVRKPAKPAKPVRKPAKPAKPVRKPAKTAKPSLALAGLERALRAAHKRGDVEGAADLAIVLSRARRRAEHESRPPPPPPTRKGPKFRVLPESFPKASSVVDGVRQAIYGEGGRVLVAGELSAAESSEYLRRAGRGLKARGRKVQVEVLLYDPKNPEASLGWRSMSFAMSPDIALSQAAWALDNFNAPSRHLKVKQFGFHVLPDPGADDLADALEELDYDPDFDAEDDAE